MRDKLASRILRQDDNEVIQEIGKENIFPLQQVMGVPFEFKNKEWQTLYVKQHDKGTHTFCKEVGSDRIIRFDGIASQSNICQCKNCITPKMPKYLTVNFICQTVFSNLISRATLCRAASAAGVLKKIGGTLLIDQDDIPKLTARVHDEYSSPIRTYSCQEGQEGNGG